MRQLLKILGLLLLLTPALFGDILILKRGGKMEGQVTFKDGKYTLRTGSGMEARFLASEVEKVIKKAFSFPEKKSQREFRQEVERKRKALAAWDFRSRAALAGKCQKKGLKDLAEELYREVLAIQSDHYGARAALGYVRFKGEWMKREDFLKKIRYGSHKGKWIPQEEKDRIERQKDFEKHFSKVKGIIRKTLILGTSREKKELVKKLESQYPAPLLAQSGERLLRDSSERVRLFSIGYLKSRHSQSALDGLVDVMIKDPSKTARIQAYLAIKTLGGPPPTSLGTILGGLENPNPTVRFAALGAVNGFNIKKALPILYSRIDGMSGDGGMYLPRQHAFFGTYRSYIREWKLGSAGTQQAGQEVPDPTIDTFFEGTVVETQLVVIEYRLVRTVIERLRR